VKRVAVFAGLLIFALLIPVLLMSVLLMSSDAQTSPSRKAIEEIPAGLIGTYQAAAATCDGLDWTVLAAIHKVETGFATGSALSSKGAQGPMQFMPATFDGYATDGDADGFADINDVDDAIFTAAAMLCANGAGDPSRLADAVWQYNHSDSYVRDVLDLAASYGVAAVPAGGGDATGLLANPRVIFSPSARTDLQAGLIDPRIVSLLEYIAQRHKITVSILKTGHSKYVRGTSRVSDHWYGRAADISVIDGRRVGPAYGAARKVVVELAHLPAPLRPDEIGSPFANLDVAGAFSDSDHQDHLHLGFD
jgi:hypothetical protein